MLAQVLIILAFIVTGIVCTFFPRAVQKYAVRSCERWPPIFKWYLRENMWRAACMCGSFG